MVEQTYTNEYVYFILGPSFVSIAISLFLLINFIFISKHLQSFMYHKLSATLAVFDVIQQIGTILGAPFLFSANEDKCPYREYMFLFGTFCKTLTVLYISGTISYVIHFSTVPDARVMRRFAIGFVSFVTPCIVAMILLNVSDTLCYDPTAGNFDIESVDEKASLGFIVLYLTPIGFCFFATVGLIIHTSVRLRTMFNAALMKLLMRLIPGPIIFSLALIPSVIFQTIEVTSGHDTNIMKKMALLGINISGALYAMFYFYACLVDNSMYRPKATTPSGEPTGPGIAGEGNLPELSWISVGHQSSSGGKHRGSTTVSNVLRGSVRESRSTTSSARSTNTSASFVTKGQFLFNLEQNNYDEDGSGGSGGRL